MKKHHGTISLLLALPLIVIASCAKMGAPSGGPRDTEPPVVLSSEPPEGTINFTGDLVTITFDEYVELSDINDKFMVSPPLSKRPDITLRGKILTVKLDEELRDSTTYTLYFQDAIRDINEGNILENYQFVFSTGSYIDSLSLHGKVYNAYNLEYPDDIMVLLHTNTADTAPLSLTPDYITRVKADGTFYIENIKPGNYRLYGLGDNNNDRLYEPGSEAFAFFGEILNINPATHYSSPADIAEDTLASTLPGDTLPIDYPIESSPSHMLYELYAFTSPQQRYYLVSTARRQSRLLEYNFSVPLDTMDFTFGVEGYDDTDFLIEESINRDTIKVWITDSLLYNETVIETVVTYPATDTMGVVAYLTDTIPLRYVAPTGRRAVRTEGLSIDFTTSSRGIPPAADITMLSSMPLKSVSSDHLSVIESGDSLMQNRPFEVLFNTEEPRHIAIKHTLTEDKEYTLIAEEGAFTSVYGETNDSLAFRFKVRKADSYGTLTANLGGYEGDVVLQVTSPREDIIAERVVKAPGRVRFAFLENGFYKLKVIYDRDGNGQFTPGDFLKGRQPEEVSFFDEEIEVKSNWDVVQDWDISVKNKKADILRIKKEARR